MRILLLEDDRSFAQEVRSHLSGWGHQVFHVNSLSSGRRFFEEQRVELVLLDLQMDDGNGLELLEELRAQGNRVPVALLTGTASVDQVSRAVQHGIKAVFLKPLELSKLEAFLTSFENTQAQDRQKTLDKNYWHAYLVGLMQAAAKCWVEESGKTVAHLAEESGIWKVHFNGTSLRARTMERYFSMDRLPQHPKISLVMKTAEYVLERYDSSPHADLLRMQYLLLRRIQETLEGKSK